MISCEEEEIYFEDFEDLSSKLRQKLRVSVEDVEARYISI